MRIFFICYSVCHVMQLPQISSLSLVFTRSFVSAWPWRIPGRSRVAAAGVASPNLPLSFICSLRHISPRPRLQNGISFNCYIDTRLICFDGHVKVLPWANKKYF